MLVLNPHCILESSKAVLLQVLCASDASELPWNLVKHADSGSVCLGYVLGLSISTKLPDAESAGL